MLMQDSGLLENVRENVLVWPLQVLVDLHGAESAFGGALTREEVNVITGERVCNLMNE